MTVNGTGCASAGNCPGRQQEILNLCDTPLTVLLDDVFLSHRLLKPY